MAEATVLMMFAALYDLDGAQDRLRQHRCRGPPQLEARQLRGKTVGFIGLGKIGRETVRLLAPWARPCNTARAATPIWPACRPMRRVDLDKLLRTSDVVVVLASLNEQSRGLLSAAEARG